MNLEHFRLPQNPALSQASLHYPKSKGATCSPCLLTVVLACAYLFSPIAVPIFFLIKSTQLKQLQLWLLRSTWAQSWLLSPHPHPTCKEYIEGGSSHPCLRPQNRPFSAPALILPLQMQGAEATLPPLPHHHHHSRQELWEEDPVCGSERVRFICGPRAKQKATENTWPFRLAFVGSLGGDGLGRLRKNFQLAQIAFGLFGMILLS